MNIELVLGIISGFFATIGLTVAGTLKIAEALIARKPQIDAEAGVETRWYVQQLKEDRQSARKELSAALIHVKFLTERVKELEDKGEEDRKRIESLEMRAKGDI